MSLAGLACCTVERGEAMQALVDLPTLMPEGETGRSGTEVRIHASASRVHNMKAWASNWVMDFGAIRDWAECGNTI